MSLKSGIIIAFGIFLLLHILLLRPDSQGIPVPGRKGSSLESLRVVQQEHGELKWILEAGKAELSKDLDAADLESLTLKMMRPAGMTISGSGGRYDFRTENLEVSGDVVVSGTSWVLHTDSLLWDSGSDRLRSDDDVRIEAKTFALEGTGLEIDTKSQIARTRNVTCTFYPR